MGLGIRERDMVCDKIEMHRWEDVREIVEARTRERKKERERDETKWENKANMRANLQSGGQRYFHEFLEIVGINFPPLFTDGFVPSSPHDPFPSPPLCEIVHAGSLIQRALRAYRPLHADAAWTCAVYLWHVSMHRRNKRVLPNLCAYTGFLSVGKR